LRVSIWSQIGSSLIKGMGYTIGVKVGKDLYDVASDKFQEVDWDKLRGDAEGAREKVSGVFLRKPKGEAGEPGETTSDEDDLFDPDLIDRTL